MTHPILLFGATSILGFNLARIYPEAILPFVTPGNRTRSLWHWPILKLADPAWSAAVFGQQKYHVLLYCHALCDVPKCEAAPDWAQEINEEHVRRVISELPEQTRSVYVSSDHVFGGDGIYDEESRPCPISV
jgi:dTDP-4-dehydrorhamnose reductase